MSPSEALEVVARVRELWPKCDWGAPTVGLFTRSIGPCDFAASVKAIDGFREKTSGSFIDVSKAIEAVKAGQPKGRGWSGGTLPPSWRPVAIRLGMKDATPQDVLVAYWSSFRGYWSDEAIWRGVVADLRSVCSLTLEQAAYVADQRVGPVPDVIEAIRADEQAAKELVMRGSDWAMAELRRRGNVASQKWAKECAERRRREEQQRAELRTTRLRDLVRKAEGLLESA